MCKQCFGPNLALYAIREKKIVNFILKIEIILLPDTCTFLGHLSILVWDTQCKAISSPNI